MNPKDLHNAFVEDTLNYRNLIESAAEGIIIINENGEIVLVNHSAEEMFGYTREELIGKKLEILLPERYRKGHIHHRTSYLESPSRRNMGIGRDLVGLRKDGSEFPIEAGLSPIKTRQGVFILSFLIDISQRKQAEQALLMERKRIQEYLDIAGVILMVINPDETIRMINKRGCQVLQRSESELLGQNWLEMCIPEAYRTELSKYCDNLLKSGTNNPDPIEYPIITGSGEIRVISWHNVLIHDEKNAVNGILCSGEDITDRVKAEQQAKLHLQQLAQADKMATLGILVSGVAHEINNPTSFIMLNGKIFSKVWKDIAPILQAHFENEGDFMLAGMPYSRAYEKIGRLIDGVTDGAKRIERIVKSLKDFARQDSGDLTEGVNINQVIESAIIIVHNLIKKTTDHFVMDLSPDLPEIRGNSQQLEQVIINLVTNACQAITNPNQKLEITARYHPENGTVVIEVIDEGAGISSENISHITDPFFTTKQATGGTGLGLSICYNIVNAHGGVLNFESELNKGMKVTVTLPVPPKVNLNTTGDRPQTIEQNQTIRQL